MPPRRRPSFPKPPLLSLLADRCSTTSQLKQVHAQMILTGRIHDNFAASRLLAASDLPYAILLFRHTAAPNSFMWNTLIRAHAGGPDPADAVRVLKEMIGEGVLLPGRHTFPFALKACVNCGGGVGVCRQIHGQVWRRGLEGDVYVGNGLVRCYAAFEMLEAARRVFDEMPERNLVVWTTMVSGYAQNLMSSEALALFEQMVGEGIEPNDATLASVLSVCAKSGCLDLGRQIHFFVEEKGIEGVILGTAIVDMYAKNGAICDAYRLFKWMPEKNTATWNAMICGLAHHGHATSALKLFKEMEEMKVVPNDVTFVGVLSACCHAGLLDLGRNIFYSMERAHGIEPKIEHYGCMVDLLGRSGRLVEAEQLISSMSWEADVAVLGALLSACKKHKNAKIAERTGKKILEMEPCNHGVYVVLSNIYAESGKWDEVAKLRKSMRAGRLKKIPGWSCVNGEEE